MSTTIAILFCVCQYRGMSCAEKLVTMFGGRRQAREALGLNRETFRLWLKKGIPLERALFVEDKSRGKIKAEAVLREARQRA